MLLADAPVTYSPWWIALGATITLVLAGLLVLWLRSEARTRGRAGPTDPREADGPGSTTP